jgi:hypothetical protein
MIDSKSVEYQAISNSPCCYDEPEGVFPDGKFTIVEHAVSIESAWPLIDLYKLKLDGSGEMQRLTHFTDFEGFKANHGVVSDDGKYCKDNAIANTKSCHALVSPRKHMNDE